MEWLGHSIRAKIDEGKWCPIHLSRTSTSLSHLFFVDDLVIFWKAELEQAQLLEGILKHFCDFSRHNISSRKKNIYFSKRVEGDLCSWISQLFNYQVVQNLDIYLGVSLLHNRVTKSTLSFVVEKVRHKIQSWKARKLSIIGRVTLA